MNIGRSNAALAMFLCGALVFLAWIIFNYCLYLAVGNEGRVASVRRVFSIAGERAIQLDRYGRVFAEEDFEAPATARNLSPPEVSNVTCKSRIVPYESRHPGERKVFAAVKSVSPVEVYLFYTGKPPDLGPVLNGGQGRKYFLPQAVKFSGMRAMPYQTYDASHEYDAYISGRTFTWKSSVCNAFSYTIILEN